MPTETLEAPSAQVQIPAAPAAPAPKPDAAERAAKLKSYFDKEMGSVDDALKAAQMLSSPVVEGSVANGVAPMPADPAAKDGKTPEGSTTTEQGKVKVETPEPPKEPVAKPARRVRRKVENEEPAALPDERVAKIAAEAAARAVQQTKPEPRQQQPEEPALDGYLHDDPDVQDTLEQLRVIEQMDEKKKGVADKYIKALKDQEEDHKRRTKEYATQWRRDNPGKTYNGQDAEHTEFFAELEEEPLPDIGVSARDLKLAERKIIEDQVAKRFEAKEQALDQRLKAAEHREEVKSAATSAAKRVQKLVGVEDISKADEWQQPILRDATDRSARFASTAYAVFNGVEQYDAKNKLHRDVVGVIKALETQLLAEPPENTVNPKGQSFLPRPEYLKLPAEQRDDYWTITHRDVIDYANDLLAEEAKATIAKEEEKLENFAKKRGYTVNGAAKPTPAPAPNGTRTVAKKAGDEPAPTFGAVQTSTLPATGAVKSGKAELSAFAQRFLQ